MIAPPSAIVLLSCSVTPALVIPKLAPSLTFTIVPAIACVLDSPAAPETVKDEWENYETENNITPVPYNGDDTGSGDDADAELTATAEASEKDAGSKSKSAVSTADESPIGTMSALAALSLLAGGYIVVRKRKKEEQ